MRVRLSAGALVLLLIVAAAAAADIYPALRHTHPVSRGRTPARAAEALPLRAAPLSHARTRGGAAASSSHALYLVTIKAPLTSARLDALRDAIAGAHGERPELLNYVPDHTYLVQATPAALDRMRLSAGAMGLLRLARVTPDAKLRAGVAAAGAAGGRWRARVHRDGQASADGSRVTRALACAAGVAGAVIVHADDASVTAHRPAELLVALDGGAPALQALAACVDIVEVTRAAAAPRGDAAERVRGASARASAVAQDTTTSASASDSRDTTSVHTALSAGDQPNYAAGDVMVSGEAGGNPLADAGLTGAGQVVGVGAPGLNSESCFFRDSAQPWPANSVSDVHRKMVSYRAWSYPRLSDVEGDLREAPGSLGTAMTTACCGAALPGGVVEANGVAPAARVAFMDLHSGARIRPEVLDADETPTGDFLSGPGDALNEYFRQLYADRARISVHAWGDVLPTDWSIPDDDDYDGIGSYYALDHFLWDAADNHLAIFPVGTVRLGTPADASHSAWDVAASKNALSVGATLNTARSFVELNRPRPESGEAGVSVLAPFSARGPTNDARIAPHVVAPGMWMLVGAGGSVGGCGSASVTEARGATIAAGAVAGAAAVVRQYLTEGWHSSGAPDPSASISDPSSALIRAILINSGQTVNGEGGATLSPGYSAGWGRVQLDAVLPVAGPAFARPFDLRVWDRLAIDNGGFTLRCLRVTKPGRPLKITIAWSDPPGWGQTFELVNDLDLIVQVKGAAGNRRFHLGNGGVSSSSEGVFLDADRLNNVEQVVVPSPGIGDEVYVSIVGTNVPLPRQDVSLAITGHFSVLSTCVQAASEKCPGSCGGERGICTLGGACICRLGYYGADCGMEAVPLTLQTKEGVARVTRGSVAAGSWIYYAFTVPPDGLSGYPAPVTVEMRRTSAVGDPDLYVSMQAMPDLHTSSYSDISCDPCESGGHSQVRIPAEEVYEAAVYYVGVHAYPEKQASFDIIVHQMEPGVLAAAHALSALPLAVYVLTSSLALLLVLL